MDLRDYYVLLDTLCELPKTMLLSIHCEHCGEVMMKVPPSYVKSVIFNAICEKVLEKQMNENNKHESCDFCCDDRSPIVRTITIKGVERNVCEKCSRYAYGQQKVELTEFLSEVFATRQSTCGTSDSVLKTEYAARFSMGEGRAKVAKKLKQGGQK